MLPRVGDPRCVTKDGAEHAAGPARRTRPPARAGSRRQARLSGGARAQGALALHLDDPQRQSPAAQPRRAEGGRPSGVLRLGRDLDDRALSRRHAAAGPRGGQAARRPRLPRAPVPPGRQSREKLERFRGFGGAQSYPSRTKDTRRVDFSTGSVGLGVGVTLFASLVQDYLQPMAWLGARRPAG